MNKEDLDMIGLLKIVWEGKKTIIIATLVCVLFGILIYFISPNEYMVKSEMVVPGGQSDGNSRLGRLAALTNFNLNLGGSTNTLKPSLYPSIVQSIPFQRKLLKTTVYSKKTKEEMTLADYMEKVSKKSASKTLSSYTIKLPSRIIKSLTAEKKQPGLSAEGNKKDSLLTVPAREAALIAEMKSRILMDVDLVDGVISLTVNMQEPEPAAQVALSVQRLLKEELKDLKAEDAAEQIKFTEELYRQKKNEFESVQRKLAKWRDQNRIISTATALNEEQNLQSEYDLIFSVYSQVAKQLETKRIEEQENVPSFTVLDPVVVPRRPASPVAFIIFLVSLFLGAFMGVSIVLFRNILQYIKSQW